MNSSYFDVYIGNLAILTSEKHLKELFSQAGDVLSVWIKDTCHRKYTYAFVTFYNLKDARKAFEVFNNQKLDGLIIKVSLSIKTQQRLSGSVRKKTENANILCEHLPKREGKEGLKKEARLRQILRKNLTEYQAEDEHFRGTFKNSLTEMKAIPPKESHALIKNRAEKIDIATLESIVIRYLEPFKKHVLFKEVDFDLSNNKVLKKEENKNYFKILANCHNI